MSAGPHRLVQYKKRGRQRGLRRLTAADSYRGVKSPDDVALFNELYLQFTKGVQTDWLGFSREFNLRVDDSLQEQSKAAQSGAAQSGAAQSGAVKRLYYKTPDMLKQHAVTVMRLVGERDSLALQHVAGLPPVVTPSLQEAAQQFMSSLVSAPSLALPPLLPHAQAPAGSALVGVTLDAAVQPAAAQLATAGPVLVAKGSRGTATSLHTAAARVQGGAGKKKCCKACQAAGVPREHCERAQQHSVVCPFAEGRSKEMKAELLAFLQKGEVAAAFAHVGQAQPVLVEPKRKAASQPESGAKKQKLLSFAK